MTRKSAADEAEAEGGADKFEQTADVISWRRPSSCSSLQRGRTVVEVAVGIIFDDGERVRFCEREDAMADYPRSAVLCRSGWRSSVCMKKARRAMRAAARLRALRYQGRSSGAEILTSLA